MQPDINEIPLNLVLTGKYQFDPDLMMSKNSRFSDSKWSFIDQELVRLNSVPSSRLVINWGNYAKGEVESKDSGSVLLPSGIIEELRIFTAFYLKVPAALTGRTNSVKPNTVLVGVKATARLFSKIYVESFISQNPVLNGLTHIKSISDITLNDLKVGIQSSPFKDGTLLKKILKYISTAVFRKYLPKGLDWNSKDIDALEFKYDQKRDNYKKAMPNDLFRLLSDQACNDVLNFLSFLDIDSADKSITGAPKSKVLKIANGKELFDEYIRIRVLDRETSHKIQQKAHFASFGARKDFKSEYGVTLQEVLDEIYRVQRAAYMVIALYTGARYSDQATFKVGCIKEIKGVHVLVGTLVKGEELNKVEENDYWPAIPIMRDALRCLEEISKVTFNPYLISGRETVAIDKVPRPISAHGFSEALSHYLHEVDLIDKWKNWKINSHQLRHTLAFQLARADVGLMFIAHQMKHLYTALAALPPAVTLTYGNLTDIASSRALGTSEAYFEATANLYDPNLPVAGGGSEDFKKRRKQYFEGMAAAGWSKEEIITHLAKQGLPFASVGVGYCAGRRDRLLKDGTKELSPCIGSLQCNPGKCHQAVITQTHLPQWKKIYQHNVSMLEDENMSHAHDLFRTAAEEAKSVLRGLGEI